MAISSYAVLALPHLGKTPHNEIRAPSGHFRQFETIWNATKDDAKCGKLLKMEYGGIAIALSQMELPFRVLSSSTYPNTEWLVEHLETIGFGRVVLPDLGAEALPHLMYPRDLLTVLPNGTVLVSIEGRKLVDMGLIQPSHQPRVSHFGEGGRVHVCGDTALTFSRCFDTSKFLNAPIAELEGDGLRVLAMSEAIMRLPHNAIWASLPQNHVDRVMGMLHDKSGALHLFADPCMETGFAAANKSPLFDAKATIHNLRMLCDREGIVLHVPRKLCAPYSLGFAQFSTGQVLMTCGEKEVERMIADIVGRDNVFTTPQPVECTAVRGLAGIHCLVNEFPNDLFIPSMTPDPAAVTP